jgi:lipid A 4'-phosphatase
LLNIYITPNIDNILFNEYINFNNFLNDPYLKDFFIKITVVGDSLWVFALSIFVYIFCYISNKIFLRRNLKIFCKIKNYAIFLFTATFFTGFLTQLLKHIVGRPRPNNVASLDSAEAVFFNFESSFHSFPSGHTSTIFVAALVFASFTPKIKYFYFCFAGIISFSRVVVGAHYVSDVIGGIAIAFIGVKLTIIFLNKIKIKNYLHPLNIINNNFFYISLIIFFIIIVFISLGSSFDIYFSSLFYQGERQFSLQSFDIFTVLVRKIFLNFLIAYVFILPLISIYIPIRKIFFNYFFSLKDVFFIFLSGLFSLLFFINMVFKNMWGRARPNEIVQLGGKENFTPWYKISDACDINCSFVSGDASVGFFIIILYFITKNKNYLWISFFSGGVLGLTRIAEGGHFFSDVLFAGFFIYVLSHLQFNIYKKFIEK